MVVLGNSYVDAGGYFCFLRTISGMEGVVPVVPYVPCCIPHISDETGYQPLSRYIVPPVIVGMNFEFLPSRVRSVPSGPGSNKYSFFK